MMPLSLSQFLSSWPTLPKVSSEEQRRNIVHALKMGVALLVAFMLVLVEFPYDQLGEQDAIWAIMTVIVVFESSVGATISRGLNRGVGTLLAALVAIFIGETIDIINTVAGQIITTLLSVSIIAGVVTFVRISWAAMKSYEYGSQTFLLTFSLISAAEYRNDDPIETALNRCMFILLGALIGISINIFVFPCWAGEQLYRSITKNFYDVADSLEACVNEYLQCVHFETPLSGGLAEEDKIFQIFQSVLNSANKEESLAAFASWEPPHGKFKMFKYPWHMYVKVGALLRHCVYSVAALHGCLRSSIQAPPEIRVLFEAELRQVGAEIANLLRKLGRQLDGMHEGDLSTALRDVSVAVEKLQQRLHLNSFLLVQSKTGLMDRCADDITIGMVQPTKAIDKHSSYGNQADAGGFSLPQEVSIYTQKGFVSKLFSFPSKPVDALRKSVFMQRVKVLDNISVLSLGTFATLLMEVAHRVEYLMEAVNELTEVANFSDLRTVY